MPFTIQCSSAQGISLRPQLEEFNYWIAKKTFHSGDITYEAYLKDSDQESNIIFFRSINIHKLTGRIYKTLKRLRFGLSQDRMKARMNTNVSHICEISEGHRCEVSYKIYVDTKDIQIYSREKGNLSAL